MKINKKLVIALTVLTLALSLGTTVALASNNGDQAGDLSTQTSAVLNLDKDGNVIDTDGNIVMTVDQLSATSKGSITSSADAIIASNDNSLTAADTDSSTAEGAAQLNLDKDGNVIDANGNIVITKDQLNLNVSVQDHATLIADPTGK